MRHRNDHSIDQKNKFKAHEKLILPEHDREKLISSGRMCRGMSDEELRKHVLVLRDNAVKIALERNAELLRWDTGARNRTQKWFGTPAEEIRQFLLPRLEACIRVLRGLQGANFVPYNSKSLELTQCDNTVGSGVAAVCAGDTKEYRIMLALGFCELRETTKIFGTNRFYEGDSQISILIHEVTHFKDVFGSLDSYVGISKSIEATRDPAIRSNADTLAGYILGME